MTRDEFYEEMCDYGDLLNFCRDHDLDACIDIYDAENICDWIHDKMHYVTYSQKLIEDIIYALREIDFDNYEYYTNSGPGVQFQWLDYTTDFYNYRNAVADEYERLEGFEEAEYYDDDDDEEDDNERNDVPWYGEDCKESAEIDYSVLMSMMSSM